VYRARVFSHTQNHCMLTPGKSYVTQLKGTQSHAHKFALSWVSARKCVGRLIRSRRFRRSSEAALAISRARANRPRSSLYHPNGPFCRPGKQTLQKLCSCRFLVHKFTCLQACARARARLRLCEE